MDSTLLRSLNDKVYVRQSAGSTALIAQDKRKAAALEVERPVLIQGAR